VTDQRAHVLFLYSGVVFDPESVPARARFTLLSQRLDATVVATVMNPAYRRSLIARATLRGVFLPEWIRHSSIWRLSCYIPFAIWNGFWLHHTERRIDVIVTPEPFVTGPIALLLHLLTGARIVAEVNGQFEYAFGRDAAEPGLAKRLKGRAARALLPFVIRRAHVVKLLYRGQLSSFLDESSLTCVRYFPNFVPTSQFGPAESAVPPYLLLVGYPWHLKGVDLLINAFRALSVDFPLLRLKIVGFCPDKKPFERLAVGDPSIELGDALPYPEVIKVIAGCTVFVLASRTEGIARVLSEAMAAKKPIVASRIGGMPAIVRDGFNGLLFESENVADLERTLRVVLGDPAFARELAENGYRFVCEELSEEKYLDRFVEVIGLARQPAQ